MVDVFTQQHWEGDIKIQLHFDLIVHTTKAALFDSQTGFKAKLVLK